MGGQFSRIRLRELCLRPQRFRATPHLGDDGREEREKNVQVKEGVTEDAFVAMRQARDAELAAQVNIRAGNFLPGEANGVRYLTIPVTLKGGADTLSKRGPAAKDAT